MTDRFAIEKENRRIVHSDGGITDVVLFRFPAHGLRLADVDQNSRAAKLRDIADYRTVRASVTRDDNPSIVAISRLDPDRPAAVVFPCVTHSTEGGEHLVSANSFITYVMRAVLTRGWLQYRQGEWKNAVPESEREWRRRTDAVIEFLIDEERVLVASEFGVPASELMVNAPFDWRTQLVTVGECAALSDVAMQQRARLVFNTSFFLLENDDIFSHHSALGEAYNLWIADGVIQRPPLYRRSALLQRKDGCWEIRSLGMRDITLVLPNGVRLAHRGVHVEGESATIRTGAGVPFTLDDEDVGDVHVFTRYFGVSSLGRVAGFTPAGTGRLELTVVGRRVVGWQEGGGLSLPQNGLVISFAPGALSATERDRLLALLQTEPSVAYAMTEPRDRDIVQAVQNGPVLLKNGICPLTDRFLEAEESFYRSRVTPEGELQVGVVPTDYVNEVAEPRYGRVGLGIDKDGDLVVAVVAGANRGLGVRGVDSEGATLVELAEILREAGAVDAINFDGGGSAQVYYYGGRASPPGDRRRIPLVHYERMVPAVGMVF